MKKVVVDTNIVISALVKDSVTRDIIFRFSGKLYFLSFSMDELKKYEQYIIDKTKQDKTEIEKLFEKLLSKMIILDDRDINLKMEEAKAIMELIDPDDTPFIAAAILTGGDIWSDDKHFEKQKRVKVWKTSEIYKMNTEE